MKTFRILSIAIAISMMAFSCSKPQTQQETTTEITVSPSSLEFSKDGGSKSLNVKINGIWQTAISASWVKLSQMGGGNINGTVEVTVPANMDAARTATITFSAGNRTATVTVNQEAGYAEDGIKKVSIAEFRKLNDSTTDWYRLTGEVVSITKEEYGDLYLLDDTGYVYVYGLAPTKGGSNTDFSKLGIKAGDKITIIALKKTYSGIIETDQAYFENMQAGSYPGIKADKAQYGFLELPATDEKDGLVYVCHFNGSKRNFSAYFDTQNRISQWVCYPYCTADKSDSRPDSYAYDPLIEVQYQADLSKSYQNRTFDGEEFIRGHMLPSAARGGRSQLDAFLATNIIPQSSKLNEGLWERLEEREREWVKKCDTLYVTVGTDVSESKYKVKDANLEKDITVPNGIYRVVLAYSKSDNSYKALAFYFDNKKNENSYILKTLPETILMSVDNLEKKLGMDFFVNLPDEVEKAVEAQDPREDTFWWN